ncbi:MAG TPA: Rpn family recombination-promoting nuclease/putative transposase [Thermoanaerobaculia bacterium]|jgi:predicted transposase/invertase (TIGR01784 family)|nr:Rpn family recombination-promoting nuclease/putative transposase [Thermoanaerobaculia bacterium]
MGQHDLSYRRFFAHQRMIRDLLREIVGERWVDLIDLDSGERVNASFVSPRHKNRESDIIWKFPRKGGGEPVYVYILMEFQSRPDPSMPVRLMGYVYNFYEDLMARQPASGWRKLPLVIPVVVYNGTEPWNVADDLGSLIVDLDPSAEIYRPRLRYRLVDESSYSQEELEVLRSPVAELFRMEKSRDWAEILTSVQRLQEILSPADGSLRQDFEMWLRKVILPRLGLSEEEAATAPTLEEFETMLAESIDRWNQEIREEGRQEGNREGEERVLLRQLRSKFGSLDAATESRVRSADANRLLDWAERVLTAERLEDVFR